MILNYSHYLPQLYHNFPTVQCIPAASVIDRSAPWARMTERQSAWPREAATWRLFTRRQQRTTWEQIRNAVLYSVVLSYHKSCSFLFNVQTHIQILAIILTNSQQACAYFSKGKHIFKEVKNIFYEDIQEENCRLVCVCLCVCVQWAINTTPFQLSELNEKKHTTHAQPPPWCVGRIHTYTCTLTQLCPHAFQSGFIAIEIL